MGRLVTDLLQIARDDAGRLQLERRPVDPYAVLSAVFDRLESSSDGRLQLTWMLGVEWPAVWRPRINVLGESILTLADASGSAAPTLVRRVDERWHQSPLAAFLTQLLPKARDFLSLYASPTAEHLPMPVVGGGDGYDLVRLPPFLALQAEWVESGDLLFVEQVASSK